MNDEPNIEPHIDLESDVNVATVRYPYGAADFHGSRVGRERYAELFLEIVKWDRRTAYRERPTTTEL